MATAILDSPKNPTSNQLRNNISKQVYISHFLSNLNANEIYSMHRNEVSNKNATSAMIWLALFCVIKS
jgi:hypothetical protein